MASKVPAIVLGALACAGVLWQMYFEGSEVAAGGAMSTQFRVVFWAQIASVVLLMVAIVFATIRGSELGVSRWQRLAWRRCVRFGSR